MPCGGDILCSSIYFPSSGLGSSRAVLKFRQFTDQPGEQLLILVFPQGMDNGLKTVRLPFDEKAADPADDGFGGRRGF